MMKRFFSRKQDKYNPEFAVIPEVGPKPLAQSVLEAVGVGSQDVKTISVSLDNGDTLDLIIDSGHIKHITNGQEKNAINAIQWSENGKYTKEEMDKIKSLIEENHYFTAVSKIADQISYAAAAHVGKIFTNNSIRLLERASKFKVTKTDTDWIFDEDTDLIEKYSYFSIDAAKLGEYIANRQSGENKASKFLNHDNYSEIVIRSTDTTDYFKAKSDEERYVIVASTTSRTVQEIINGSDGFDLTEIFITIERLMWNSTIKVETPSTEEEHELGLPDFNETLNESDMLSELVDDELPSLDSETEQTVENDTEIVIDTPEIQIESAPVIIPESPHVFEKVTIPVRQTTETQVEVEDVTSSTMDVTVDDVRVFTLEDIDTVDDVRVFTLDDIDAEFDSINLLDKLIKEETVKAFTDSDHGYTINLDSALADNEALLETFNNLVNSMGERPLVADEMASYVDYNTDLEQSVKTVEDKIKSSRAEYFSVYGTYQELAVDKVFVEMSDEQTTPVVESSTLQESRNESSRMWFELESLESERALLNNTRADLLEKLRTFGSEMEVQQMFEDIDTTDAEKFLTTVNSKLEGIDSVVNVAFHDSKDDHEHAQILIGGVLDKSFLDQYKEEETPSYFEIIKRIGFNPFE